MSADVGHNRHPDAGAVRAPASTPGPVLLTLSGISRVHGKGQTRVHALRPAVHHVSEQLRQRMHVAHRTGTGSDLPRFGGAHPSDRKSVV